MIVKLQTFVSSSTVECSTCIIVIVGAGGPWPRTGGRVSKLSKQTTREPHYLDTRPSQPHHQLGSSILTSILYIHAQYLESAY